MAKFDVVIVRPGDMTFTHRVTADNLIFNDEGQAYVFTDGEPGEPPVAVFPKERVISVNRLAGE